MKRFPLQSCRNQAMGARQKEQTQMADAPTHLLRRNKQRWLSLTIVIVTVVTSASAQPNQHGSSNANHLKVDCDKKQTIGAALNRLAMIGHPTNITIDVTGTCNEDVLVQSFDRLTIVAGTGTQIVDPSKGTKNTVDIEDSRSVTLQGFTIQGGAEGVICGGLSICYLTGNTIEGSLDSGVLVSASSNAVLSGNIVENNARGLTANLSSSVNSNNDTFQNNVGAGIAANQGNVFAFTSVIESNGSNGTAAVNSINHSEIRLITSTVAANTSAGVQVQGGSQATFEQTAVTGNGSAGVIVKDGSYARFTASNVSGNAGGTDVSCRPQFPATRGALTDISGGTTNCTEP